MVVRGCGIRFAGAVYLEVKTSPRGYPLEHFLQCPPVPITAERYGLSKRGVSIIQDATRPDVYHVWDWMGGDTYPNVADFVEETRRHGASRRIAKNASFGLLTAESRLVILHDRAIIMDPEPYWNAVVDDAPALSDRRPCPRGVGAHTFGNQTIDLTKMCSRLWWDDVEGGAPVYNPDVPYRTVERTVGGTTYTARRAPDAVEVLGLKATEYHLGIVATFPISNIAVIKSEDNAHVAAWEAASQSGLPVSLEDE